MSSNRNQNFRRKPFSTQIADRRLLPRIEQFISQAYRGRVPDAEKIADHLCTIYPEYRRKKRNWFVNTVVKALGILRHNHLNEEARLQDLEQHDMSHQVAFPTNPIEDGNAWNDFDSSESDVEIVDTKEPLVEVKDSNGVNKAMHQMYARSARESTSESPGRGQPRVKNTPLRNDLSHIEKEATSCSQSPRKIDVAPEGAAGAESPFQDTGQQEDTKNSSNNHFMVERKSNESDTIEIIDVTASPPNNKHPVKGAISDSVPRSAGEDRANKRRPLKRKAESKKRDDEEEGPPMARSTVTFEDIGGCEGCLQEISKLILHMRHPEVFHQLGVEPPRGFLLHGPPGCGKTLLANAIAGELGLPFYKVAATEMVSGVSGESEEKIRNLFSEAKARSPSILFFDEIDAITPKRETVSREMERRIVSQLLFCLDDLVNSEAHVLVIGATNRPDALDPALRRAGRFDREICMGIPDRKARAKILEIQCRSLRLEDPFDYEQVAALTPGFVGADLMALTREAAMCAVDRVFKDMQSDPASTGDSSAMEADTGDEEGEAKRKKDGFPTLTEARRMVKSEPPLSEKQLSTLYIEVQDFRAALPLVQPSAKREGFATIPDVTWDDIGALEDIKEELSMAVLAPVKHQEQFDALGLATPPGILLAGPPGCGKTLLAKAVANEAGVNFISVKGPELLNMYVGESERAVRQVFQRARNSAPCVIFFDEIDALCPRRSDMAESSASSRVVNQLLTEMDGLEVRKQVFLMGATNRPDIIDPAILRPGRLDKRLYVGLPGKEDRAKILTKITKGGSKPALDGEVDLVEIAADERCERFSGADLAALVRESSTNAIREHFKSLPSVSGDLQVKKSHFESAFAKVKPSVSAKDQLWYLEMVKTMNS